MLTAAPWEERWGGNQSLQGGFCFIPDMITLFKNQVSEGVGSTLVCTNAHTSFVSHGLSVL